MKTMTTEELSTCLGESEAKRIGLLRRTEQQTQRIYALETALLKTKHDCQEAIEHSRGLTKGQTASVIDRVDRVLETSTD